MKTNKPLGKFLMYFSAVAVGVPALILFVTRDYWAAALTFTFLGMFGVGVALIID